MARSPLFYEKLNAENVFHIYNRTNNDEAMFVNDDNRFRFLYNLEKYVSPYADILGLNLLSNHFHLIIEVKNKDDFLNSVSKAYINELPPVCKSLVREEESNMAEILENRFRSMFSGYTTYFNVRHKRRGNFFNRPFCRKWIRTNEYLKQAIYYVNTNSVKHGLHDNFLDHDWTSFHQVVNGDCTLINIEKLYRYFDGQANFLEYHLKKQSLEDLNEYAIEEKDIDEKLVDEEE